MAKVIVGMSGGVDSSVTAYLLQRQGYDVEGVSFLMQAGAKDASCRSCCVLDSMDSASKTAQALGIAHSTIDVSEAFQAKVVAPFIDAYIKGMTPNPCVLCNRFIKFPFLIAKADERGAGFIATGHYARVEAAAQGREQGGGTTGHEAGRGNALEGFHVLKKGVDPKKDQSYFLYVLCQEELKRLLLPLGRYKKEDVRNLARQLKLPATEMSESQEICFIEDRKYLSFIQEHAPAAAEPGPIADMNGRVIGTHKGIYGYTIGQRKGMGIASPEPLYVADIDVLSNTLYVGPHDAAMRREIAVGDLNWIVPPVPAPDKGEVQSGSFKAHVKVRSAMKEAPATVFFKENTPLPPFAKGGAPGDIVRVAFDAPQWAPAPGQSAVFYEGDTVVGGGVINKRA